MLNHSDTLWKKEMLNAFFTELGAETCARIEVCALDLWGPYIASIYEHTRGDCGFHDLEYFKPNEDPTSMREIILTWEKCRKNKRKSYRNAIALAMVI